MSAREIITLQFGNYSNYISTHYWNFHYKRMLEKNDENESHYVNKLFRENISSTRSHFVPRTICFDIKTKLQSLKKDGSFNGTVETMETDQDCILYSEPNIEKNEFMQHILAERDLKRSVVYELDDKVLSWSDFMMYELNDHSMQLLQDTYNDGEDFCYFGLGQQEHKCLQNDFEDNLHFWAEECDHLEGFQLFGDLHNGYCGLMSKVLEDISDEYRSKAKLSFLNWACNLETSEKDQIYHYLNVALTLQSLKELCSLTVLQSTNSNLFTKASSPIKFKNINYKNELPYHTTAILAAAIDSSTIPLYQVNPALSMLEICHQVSQGKWNLAGTAFGIPIQSSVDKITLFEQFSQSNGFYGNSMTSLFPQVNDTSIVPSTHLLVLQNIPRNLVCPSNIESSVLQGLGLNRNVFNQNPYSVLEFFNEKFYPSENTATKMVYSHEKLRTDLPFPSIVENLQDNEKDKTCMSSLFTSPQFYEFIASVIKALRRMNLHKFHTVQEFGLDKDALNELIEDLISMKQSYNHERAFNELEE